jgi:putative flavoprotein involved in K+ transport
MSKRENDGGRALPERTEVAVVGAGAAGLGVAASLRRRGIEAIVLERAAVASSWRARYEGVRLNTVRWMSSLPGMAIPRSAGRWPSRNELIAYMERYADREGLDVHTGVSVRRIQRHGDRYRLHTSAGDLEASFVVVAAGYDHTPLIPAWPGRDGFTGELLHAAEYRSAERFRGKRVLVAGIGNSGSEIAAELVCAGARVQVAMRTPPNLLRREIFGIPATVLARLSECQPAPLVDRTGFLLQRLLFGDLTRYGLPRAANGIATELRVKGLGPVLDSGFVGALKSRQLELVAPIARLDGAAVILADGRRVQPDVVIAATGYRHELEQLVGHLGVLTKTGRPIARRGGTHPEAPRLYFNGYWLPMSGQLPAMRRTSKAITRSIARERSREARAAHSSAGARASGRPTRPRSSAMLNIPWKAGAAAPERGGVLIAATETRFGHYRDLPGAAIAALRLRRGWRALEGAVALSLSAQPLKRTTRSISVWQSEEHLLQFLRSPAHVAIVRRYRGRLSIRSAIWSSGSFSRMHAREEAERRLCPTKTPPTAAAPEVLFASGTQRATERTSRGQSGTL